MNELELRRSLAKKSDQKIVLFVMDGVGGLPGPEGLTELQAARTPNLDGLAAGGACGLLDPVAPGITPGSGPGHLGLFGYEPTEHLIGRGALSAAGVGFPLEATDVAMRMNFCSLDEQGRITDRRAGRISTEHNRQLVPLLRQIRVDGAKLFVETEKDYRAVVVFRPTAGPLGAAITDSDPQRTGVAPLEIQALDEASRPTARIVNDFLAQAFQVLAGHHPANGVLVRGASGYPSLPTFPELYKLTPAVVATYPMYRGVARFAGMEVLGIDEIEGFSDQLRVLEQHWDRFDFFFVHYKYTDSKGEDSNFAAKVAEIEQADAGLGRILALKPDVIAATGDHSTPATYGAHSWHPVPVAIGGKHVRRDAVQQFDEISCAAGSLGRFRAKHLLPELLAAAGKLEKFGA